QMPAAVKPAQVTGKEPTVHDRLGRKLRVVEIMRHYGLAVYRNLADSLGIGLQDSQFNSGQRFANGIRAKWLEVVEGKRRTGFCESVSICHGNPEVVKELQSRRLHERSAGEQGSQLSAECLVYLAKQRAAQPQAGLPLRAEFVDGNGAVHEKRLGGR